MSYFLKLLPGGRVVAYIPAPPASKQIIIVDLEAGFQALLVKKIHVNGN